MNFPLILFLLTAFTLCMWLLDVLVLAPGRRRQAEERLKTWEREQQARGGKISPQARQQLKNSLHRRPAWLDYTAGLFPVLFVVFVVRSFLFEPFKIPSGSMIPTLLVGDLILVNKYSYGVRLPVFDTKIIEVGEPQRGDTVVFRYPMDPSVDYIKRVIGVPGDTITVRRGRVFLNGEEAPLRPAGDYFDAEQDADRSGESGHRAAAAHARDREVLPSDLRGADLQGAREKLLRDGGQPRQQSGQPQLGIRSREEPGWTGVFHLDEFQRSAENWLIPVNGSVIRSGPDRSSFLSGGLAHTS